MGLQIWLPLNGDLHNQGILGNLNFTKIGRSGTIIDTNEGKIGKAKEFSAAGLRAPLSYTLGSQLSFSCWIYYNSFQTNNEWILELGDTETGYANALFGIASTPTNLVVCVGGAYDSATTHDFVINTWYHLAFTYDSTTWKIYKNGQLIRSFDKNIKSITSSSKISIASNVVSSVTKLNGRLNDIRIYNNCLSDNEIKEISKGLILHYPLNRNGWGLPSNLLKNGFGELGTENWNKGVYTDDLPSIDTSIQARFQDSTSIEYIPIYRNHIYRYSTYIKSSETSGSCYPSILPYDRDYNFIAYSNCATGFNLDTMTVLTQELKSGDNKIYVEDLSQWNTNSGNYQNYAAIFGYADSAGYIYPDGVYTQNTLQFASGTNAKTNLDKTNNIITLIANYTGPTIPVGTHVCASSAGSQYFYPFGAISCKSVSNWTYKTATFSSNDDRLLNAKYVRISSYGKCTQAGILLEDVTSDATLNGTIQYDISGYQNNGTKNNITYNSDTPKYNVSSVFNSADTSYIKVNENNWMGQYATVLTINAWVYVSNWSNLQKLYSCTQTGGWGTTSAGDEGYLSFTIYVATTETKDTYTYKTNTKALKISDITPGWHMITFLYDSNIGHKIYLDGELHSFLNFTSYGVRYNESTRLFLGCEAGDAVATTPYFDGKFSDFRIYATALSEKDILSLYNNEAYIDQLNTIHGEIR